MNFIEYFSQHVTKVKVVPKEQSSFMKMLGGFLTLGKKLKLTNIDKQSFMNDYTTTIGHTIYSNDMTEDSDPSSLMTHEICHVLQFKVCGMSTAYLFSPKQRAFYESEAAQASLLCFPGTKTDDAWVERKVKWLMDYGCKETVARREILARLDELKRGEPLARPQVICQILIDWKASN